jgi:transcriptional regulator with XRE-family HTH domain
MGKSHAPDLGGGTGNRDRGTSGTPNGRKRTALRPLSPELPDPVRAFVEELRRIYRDRTEHNQGDLATALHLTKSTISRYLNGQQIMPAQTLTAYAELAGLTRTEREWLHTLHTRAATQPGHAVSEAIPESEPARRRPAAVWLVAGLVVVAGVTAAVLVLSSRDDPAGTDTNCRLTRHYQVAVDGDLLDADGRIVGRVYRGDEFVLEPAPPPNPYPHRYYGHIEGRHVAGYADQAKLDFAERACP